MKVSGKFYSSDKNDRVLVIYEADCGKSELSIQDCSRKDLARIWLEVRDGQLILMVKRSAYLGEPTCCFRIAQL